MSLLPKSKLLTPPGQAYLNTAGQGLVCERVAAAAGTYFTSRAGGEPPLRDLPQLTKRGVGELMGVVADDIALVGSTSEAINLVYSAVPLNRGDNVVVLSDQAEFPSVLLPALERVRRGELAANIVRPASAEISAEEIADAVDERTRLVFLSHVSYRSGTRVDIKAVAEAVRARSDAVIAVDASQSLGVIPVPASHCDFVVSTAFKWLMGAHGVAVLYWNRTRHPDLTPLAVGWHSVEGGVFNGQLLEPRSGEEFNYRFKPTADRFELGNPPYLPLFALRESVTILNEYDSARVESHALDLSGLLIERLSALGLPLLTPTVRSARAGIVAWTDPNCERNAARLHAEGVTVTGNSGRIRAAVHLYNDTADLDHLVAACKRCGLVDAD